MVEDTTQSLRDYLNSLDKETAPTKQVEEQETSSYGWDAADETINLINRLDARSLRTLQCLLSMSYINGMEKL